MYSAVLSYAKDVAEGDVESRLNDRRQLQQFRVIRDHLTQNA